MTKLPSPLYQTNFGAAYPGDSRNLLKGLDDESVDLVVTSPPFALLREKDYGNPDQGEYVDWLLGFTEEIQRVLKETGSFVLDLGGAYKRGRPVRSLYPYKVLIRLCEDQGWNLPEEFFWYNPSKLPSPIEWVNKRKIRVKDAVNTVWWLSKSDFPKADVTNVLKPYSDRMKKLLEDKEKYYDPKKRPSGHDISHRFEDNGGAIPPNLLEIPNTSSNSKYLRACRTLGLKSHSARFPKRLPKFFIEFLTDPGDTVLDIFAGSNTTGIVAEELRRKWIAFELDREYLACSAFRFLPTDEEGQIRETYDRLASGELEGFQLPQVTQLRIGEEPETISPDSQ